MTDINLKTLTPDTSLPTTGFLFGADSQATANPSVYSTQTVATTLLGSTSLTGDTLTASAPVLNLTQTWNNGAVTFTGVRFNAAGSSSTNSAAASLLMDLQVGGTSQFKVDKTGLVTYLGTLTAGVGSSQTVADFSVQSFPKIKTPNISIYASNSAGSYVYIAPGFFVLSTTDTSGINFILTTKAAANIQLGSTDAAAPVAQTLSVQSVVAGTTSNGAGADFKITGSQGTGSGAGGSIIFQTAAANTGGGATVQNTLANAMVIDSVKTVRLGTGYTVATLPAAGTAGRRTYVTDALAPVYLGTLTGGGAVVCPVFDNGTAWVSA